VPSTTEVTYHGSYVKLDGIRMSEAYASTLRISFDVRGGLLIRQIHHWAADLFVAALMVHMLRVFFTGAFRKPREVNWLIGLTLFALALIEGLFGYSLPDDQLSGAGLRIFEGSLQGIRSSAPTWRTSCSAGRSPATTSCRGCTSSTSAGPGHPAGADHRAHFIMFWQKHTQMPAKGNTERNVTGQPSYPYFAAKTSAWFIFIFGALALLATFARSTRSGCTGRTRRWPSPRLPARLLHGHPGGRAARHARLGVELPRAHGHVQRAHTVRAATGHNPRRGGILAVLRAVGHRRQGVPPHQRPAAERPGAHRRRHRPPLCSTACLWTRGANDVVADKLQIPLYTVTWIARVAVIVAPIIAYFITNVSAWAAA
jgi:ubiquinol-cytochrome c reductase cytochrome b subunit